MLRKDRENGVHDRWGIAKIGVHDGGALASSDNYQTRQLKQMSIFTNGSTAQQPSVPPLFPLRSLINHYWWRITQGGEFPIFCENCCTWRVEHSNPILALPTTNTYTNQKHK